MKHIWSIACNRSSIDCDSNLLSAFECLEEMSIAADKDIISSGGSLALPAEFYLITLWLVEEDKGEEKKIRWEFIDPTDKVLSRLDKTIQATAGVKRLRNRIKVGGLPLTSSGRYCLRLSHWVAKKYVPLSEIPVDINIEYR